MSGSLKRAVAERVSGNRPSAPRAAMAAVAAGATATVLTYRILRH